MAGRTIFERVKEHERTSRAFSVMFIPVDQVPRVAREIRDSIPVTKSGEQCWEIDMKSAVMGGKIRISKTTLKVRA